MKLATNFRLMLAAALLPWVVGESAAVGLGKARGAVVLGAGLDITIPVQWATDEDPQEQCLQAQVHYGEVIQASATVDVQMDPVVAGSRSQVHVHAAAPVDEPLVSVNLQVGCIHQVSRTYVFFAEIAPEIDIGAIGSAGDRAIVAPRPAARLSQGQATGAASTGLPVPSTRTAMPGPGVQADVVQGSQPRPPLLAKKPRPRASSNTASAGSPQAAPAAAASASSVEDLQKRVDAVEQRKAADAPPASVAQPDAALDALLADIKKLRDQTARDQKAMQTMADRLREADTNTVDDAWIYGLGGLTLFLALGVGVAWSRTRNSRGAVNAPWWREPASTATARRPRALATATATGTTTVGAKGPAASPARTRASTASAGGRPAKGADVDLDLGLSNGGGATLVDPNRKSLTPASAGRPNIAVPAKELRSQRDFGSSAGGALRAMNSQEMLDVRQQADFFMTLGQYQEAIDLLLGSIHESGESDPLVYLDLLQVLHTLSRKQDYDVYRDEFNHLFSGVVPPYELFHDVGNGLESFPDICSRIVELWPRREAADFIERCMVRARGDQVNPEFDLEAFKDLLLLHSILLSIAASTDSAPAPFSTARTLPAPVDPAIAEPIQIIPKAETVVPKPIPSALTQPMDLDLSVPEHNLIDFDVSILSKLPGPDSVK